MLVRKKIVFSVGVALALASAGFFLWLFPVSLLAAPEWKVTVVDENGKPVQGMTVREIWQNYSVEVEGHEMDRQTDANGQVSFPAHRADYSLLSQIAGSLSAIVRFNVHASYGPHATVFAFGNHLEGSATTGEYITDRAGHHLLGKTRRAE